MKSIVRFIKGLFMGFADVVPGVSGGTVALVLGIYVDFIEGIKSLNIRWLPHIFKWIVTGFSREHLEAAKEDFFAIHWAFLIALGAGIVTAFAIGSQFIPGLMEEHPTLMRAFFIGLVLASIIVPWQQIRTRSPQVIACIIIAAIGTYFLVGAGGSAPVRWASFSADKQVTMKEFVRQHPSTEDPLSLYCTSSNSEAPHQLRGALQQYSGNDIARLDHICKRLNNAQDDVQAHAEITEEYHLSDNDRSPFDQSQVAKGTTISIPQPAYWYVFFCGILAICAMVLPGISGSFILLMLGSYFFVLSSIKGSIEFALGSGGDIDAVIYVMLFNMGALIGITSFVRLLSWLFKKHHDATLAILIGLMVGSLRVLWPFKLGSAHGGPVTNILPQADDPVVFVVGLVVLGFVLVIGLSELSKRIEYQLEK